LQEVGISTDRLLTKEKSPARKAGPNPKLRAD